MELTAEILRVADVPVVHLTGELEMNTSGKVRDVVLSLVEHGAREIIINLDGIQFIDSTGLGMLVGVLKTMKDQGRRLCLAANNPVVERVFGITGLRNVFCFERTDAEAAQMLQQKPGPVTGSFSGMGAEAA